MDISNKCLLVTGGTGSFGETVVKSFLQTDIGEIRIFSRDEKKQYDLRQKYNNSRLSFHLGDVRSIKSLNRVMPGVDFVFHAAALKHVPSFEFFPLEAIETNTLGTENVIQGYNSSLTMLGGGNTGGGIQNDTSQQNKIEESSQISNDMDDEIPF